MSAVGAEQRCPNCGSPWSPDLSGKCSFCGYTPAGATAGRPVVDPEALRRRLMELAAADPADPLDRLGGRLQQMAGERVSTQGRPVQHLEVRLDDWVYEASLDHGDVQAQAVHRVRGVVLKRQPLPFDEWVAALAGHLAEYAGSHRPVYDAILAPDHR